jgi:SecD/SecF fusion protein
VSDYFERVERQLVGKVNEGAARRTMFGIPLGYVGSVAAVLVVIGVFVAFTAGRGTNKPSSSLAGRGALTVQFRVATLDGRAVTGAMIDRTARIMASRITGFHDAYVRQAGDGVAVVVPRAAGVSRARIIALAAPGRFAMYDWEANVLTPDGRTVASQLRRQAPLALEISQGSSGAAPGEAGAGSLPLFDAVRIAGAHRAMVLQASDLSPNERLTRDDTRARFYVLRNNVALTGADIVDPRQATDAGGNPDVTFGFTRAGRTAFRHVTAALSRRGSLVSGLGQTLDQHFAVALDDKLITVPSIDFKTYPDGIPADHGADITGGFTVRAARDFATILRYGPLPVRLVPAG